MITLRRFLLKQHPGDSDLPCAVSERLLRAAGALPPFSDRTTRSIGALHAEAINTADVSSVLENLEHVARFVNPDETTWSQKNVVYALSATLRHDSGIASDPRRFAAEVLAADPDEFGEKTSTYPYRYDLITLYTLATVLGAAIPDPLSPSDHLRLRRAISDAMAFPPGSLSPAAAAVLALHSGSCDCALAQTCADSVADAVVDIVGVAPGIRAVTRMLVPGTAADAIALTAALFAVDLSRAAELGACPIAEYYKVSADAWCYSDQGSITAWYRPSAVGTEFAARLTASPSQFDLRSKWVPAFSRLYTPSQLAFFARTEGFEVGALGSTTVGDETPAGAIAPARKLISHASPEAALWYAVERGGIVAAGIHPDVAWPPVSPVSLDNLSSREFTAEYGEAGVISIGVPRRGGMVAYSVADLAGSFAALHTFILPSSGSVLSERMIRKLKSICRAHCADEFVEREEVSIAFARLSTAIADVEALNAAIEARAARLADSAAAAGCTEEAKTALTRLLEAGMYMRSWKVASDPAPDGGFPLRSVNTTFDADGAHLRVDENVSMAIYAYDDAIAAIGDEATQLLIREIPLLNVTRNEDGDVRFWSVANLSETTGGNTIEDRLSIVREGERGESIFSCIRMTSNLVVASAYFYLAKAFTAPPAFDIGDLQQIF